VFLGRETKDAIEEEILESVPKTMKTKAELLVRKMKADPSIAWSEKLGVLFV
jgi:hypothetical protein